MGCIADDYRSMAWARGGHLPRFKNRQEVFTKEQGFAEEADRDAFDSQAMHILMRDGEKPVATGRLYFDGAKLFIGRICVLREYRGQAIGDLMTRMMILRGFDFAREIYLHAQQQAQGFYERYGFQVQGEPFFGGRGAPHVLMVLKKEDAVFPSKCGENCAKKLMDI